MPEEALTSFIVYLTHIASCGSDSYWSK